jgi:hypothetical protein
LNLSERVIDNTSQLSTLGARTNVCAAGSVLGGAMVYLIVRVHAGLGTVDPAPAG